MLYNRTRLSVCKISKAHETDIHKYQTTPTCKLKWCNMNYHPFLLIDGSNSISERIIKMNNKEPHPLSWIDLLSVQIVNVPKSHKPIH